MEDILDHYPSRPYDHIVVFGVIEHIPNYRRFCERAWGALVPGGRLYIDASATREKYASTAFTREYTWHGPHSCLAVQDLVEELLFHGFDVLQVRQETHDYELTMGTWAKRFDEAHGYVADRWSESVYRAFRISSGAAPTGSRPTACRPTASSPSAVPTAARDPGTSAAWVTLSPRRSAAEPMSRGGLDE